MQVYLYIQNDILSDQLPVEYVIYVDEVLANLVEWKRLSTENFKLFPLDLAIPQESASRTYRIQGIFMKIGHEPLH